MSYDLMSGCHHVGLLQESRTYVGFKWGGMYYVYNCLPYWALDVPFDLFKGDA